MYCVQTHLHIENYRFKGKHTQMNGRRFDIDEKTIKWKFISRLHKTAHKLLFRFPGSLF